MVPVIYGLARVVYEHGEPHGIRDDHGYITFFNRVTKFSGQEGRYRRELENRQAIADLLVRMLNGTDGVSELIEAAQDTVSKIVDCDRGVINFRLDFSERLIDALEKIDG